MERAAGVPTPLELEEAVRAVPGMDRILPALDGAPSAFLVGGAVRDLLHGVGAVDLDLCVEGDAVETARVLAERLGGGEVVGHQRFGTATVRAGGLSVDLAETRREFYERPGALPRVEPADLEEDLGRRDFTVNAMAAALNGPSRGRLIDPYGGLADLDARAIRVLHPRSFEDDPTRLLRAVRYEARLDARMDPETEARARAAVAAGALATVSGPRVRVPLLALLSEAEVGWAVGRLADLGIDRALHPALDAQEELAASAALASLETGAGRTLAVLAALVSSAPEPLATWLEQLGLPGDERDRVRRAAAAGPVLAETLASERPDSELHALLGGEPPEALALALALGAPGGPVLRYLERLRRVRLEVTGRELLDAGVPPSPALGRALAETLRRKLDGEVAGHDEELRMALALAREHGA